MTTNRYFLNATPLSARAYFGRAHWRSRRPLFYAGGWPPARDATYPADVDDRAPDDQAPDDGDGGAAGEAYFDSRGEAEAPIGEPVVTVPPGVLISSNALRVLKDVLRSAGIGSAMVSSGRRTPADQARIMYNNLVNPKYGVAYNRRMYGSYGDLVIDTFEAGVAARQSPDQIKKAMEAKILAIGPSRVSNHCNPEYDTFDVAPSSISDPPAMERAVVAAERAGKIQKHLSPFTTPKDPAFHIEIKLAPPELPAPVAYTGGFAEAEAAPAARGPAVDPCGVARPAIDTLRRLLHELDVAKARTRADSPQVVSCRERVRQHVRGLIDRLPDFVQRGCCAGHLKRLAEEVRQLPWEDHPRVREAGEALQRALVRAQERARVHGACRHAE